MSPNVSQLFRLIKAALDQEQTLYVIDLNYETVRVAKVLTTVAEDAILVYPVGRGSLIRVYADTTNYYYLGSQVNADYMLASVEALNREMHTCNLSDDRSYGDRLLITMIWQLAKQGNIDVHTKSLVAQAMLRYEHIYKYYE